MLSLSHAAPPYLLSDPRTLTDGNVETWRRLGLLRRQRPERTRGFSCSRERSPASTDPRELTSTTPDIPCAFAMLYVVTRAFRLLVPQPPKPPNVRGFFQLTRWVLPPGRLERSSRLLPRRPAEPSALPATFCDAAVVDIDRTRLRALLNAALVSFTSREGGSVAVLHGILQRGVRSTDGALPRATVASSGKAGLCAAIALALDDDATGLYVLRDPHARYCTNSCIEVGLAQCARLLLRDVHAPLRFINASLVGRELAALVGAEPPEDVADE